MIPFRGKTTITSVNWVHAVPVKATSIKVFAKLAVSFRRANHSSKPVLQHMARQIGAVGMWNVVAFDEVGDHFQRQRRRANHERLHGVWLVFPWQRFN